MTSCVDDDEFLFLACVSRWEVARARLLTSPCLQAGKRPLWLRWNASSAAEAFNDVMDASPPNAGWYGCTRMWCCLRAGTHCSARPSRRPSSDWAGFPSWAPTVSSAPAYRHAMQATCLTAAMCCAALRNCPAWWTASMNSWWRCAATAACAWIPRWDGTSTPPTWCCRPRLQASKRPQWMLFASTGRTRLRSPLYPAPRPSGLRTAARPSKPSGSPTCL